MAEILNKFSVMMSKDTVFWFCALAGTALFVIQFLLVLLGVLDHEDLDEGGEWDASKIKWLSKQALTGFLMMFGWSALAAKHEFGLNRTIIILIGFAMGIVTVFVTGFLFKMAKKLRSTGTVFRLDDAIGKEAVVYQRIPKEGVGKISISLHNFTHEIDAVSINEELPSFVSVEIIKKLDDKTVIVVPIKR